jgi:hypothetical protein
VARSHCARCRAPSNWGRKHARGDDGVILVFWALCLPVLLGLLLATIQLGNLLQSTDNARNVADATAQNAADATAQNAADAAATAAASYLATIHPTGQMVVQSIPIICLRTVRHGRTTTMSCECSVGAQDVISSCAHYDWLDGYYIYETDQWEAVGSQVSFSTALSDPAGTWTCQSRDPTTNYCSELNVYPPDQSYGVNGSVSDGDTISQALTATATAMSVEGNYGVANYSGCTPPAGFLLAEGPSAQNPTGVTCIGYDAAGTIWVGALVTFTLPGVGSAVTEKSSWATVVGGKTVLCPGPPPSGSCN